MKAEVYSWRVSRELKGALEAQARRRTTSLAQLLEEITREWLSQHAEPDGGDRQRRLHAAARRCFGTLNFPEAGTAANVRRVVAQRVLEKLASRRAR